MDTVLTPIPVGMSMNTMDNPRALTHNECCLNVNMQKRGGVIGSVVTPLQLTHNPVQAHYILEWSNGIVVDLETGRRQMLVVCPGWSIGGESSSGGLYCFSYPPDYNTLINPTFVVSNIGVLPSVSFALWKWDVYIMGMAQPLNYYGEPPTLWRTDTKERHFLYRWDGRLNESKIPYAEVGCEWRGRLWIAHGANLYWTQTSIEVIDPESYATVGLLDEDIVALQPVVDGLLVIKNRSVYKITYSSLDAESSDMRCELLSSEAGAASSKTVQRKDQLVFFFNEYGVYSYIPESVEVSEARFLKVGRNIYDIGLPIRNLTERFSVQHRKFDTYNEYSTLRNPSTTTWSSNLLDEFSFIFNLSRAPFYPISILVPVQVVRQIDLNQTGYAVSKVDTVVKSSDRLWDNCLVEYIQWGRTEKAENQIIVEIHAQDDLLWEKVYRVSGQVRAVIPITEKGVDTHWERVVVGMKIPGALRHEAKLQFRLALLPGTGTKGPPGILKVLITTEEFDSRIIGSGLLGGRYYIFGEDYDTGERRYFSYGDDGWNEVTFGEFEHLNQLFEPVLWRTNPPQYIVGFGKLEPDPESGAVTSEAQVYYIPTIKSETSNEKYLHWLSGAMDLDVPERDKKVRKVYLTYKGASGGQLNIYDVHGNSVTYDLPPVDDWTMIEREYGTLRSKYVQFEILAYSEDFSVRENGFQIKFKLMKANE